MCSAVSIFAEAVSNQDTRLKQIFDMTITTIFFRAFLMNVSSIAYEYDSVLDGGVVYYAAQANAQIDAEIG